MSIEIRPAEQHEMGQLGLLSAYVYGGAFGDGEVNVTSSAQRPQWTLCAFDGANMVSMFATTPFTMRACGHSMPMGGVSSVGTLPEYRRGGLLRRIMTQALSEMRDRGQYVAALWASQAAIYQRYQFALASVQRSYTIDSVNIRFHDGDTGDCVVRRVPIGEAFDTIKAIYIHHIADRICYLHRARPLWQHSILSENDSDGPLFAAISRSPEGEATGYVIYTLRDGRVDNRARPQELKIREMIALTASAYRSLWQFIARHDLVGRVLWTRIPADDPAPELFMEPRLLHAQEMEGLWFRVVDVAGALRCRGYPVQHTITIGIDSDDLTPWNSGTYRIETAPTGGTVEKTSALPDIQCSIKSLSSLFTGFRSASYLSNAGLLHGSAENLIRADQVFATSHAAHCPDHF